MGIHETRRANLRWLIDNRYAGVAANLAKDLRIQASQISRVFGGESMMEDFYPGEIIIVDPEIAPKPGDFVVAKLDKDDKVVFRKYRLRGSNESGQPAIELAPLNENYPTAVIDSNNPGRVIGTMAEHRKFRRTDRVSPPEPYASRRRDV